MSEHSEAPRPVTMNDLRRKLWLSFLETPLHAPLALAALAEALCKVEETTAKLGVHIAWTEHGEEKWRSMIEQLNDPDKILFTYSHVIPNFLDNALRPGASPLAKTA